MSRKPQDERQDDTAAKLDPKGREPVPMRWQHQQHDPSEQAQEDGRSRPYGCEEPLGVHEVTGVQVEGPAGGVGEHVVLPKNGPVKVPGDIAVRHDVGHGLMAAGGVQQKEEEGEGEEDCNAGSPPALITIDVNSCHSIIDSRIGAVEGEEERCSDDDCHADSQPGPSR